MTLGRRFAAAMLTLAGLATAGCTGPAEHLEAQTVITVVADRDLGLESVVGEYTRTHPGITVQTRTAAAPGGDIAVIDDYAAARLAAKAGDYVDLGGAGGRWGGWALPFNVDGVGLCYQRELFAEAGLPTDRDAVAALWPTWEAFLQVGQRFQAAKLPSHWTDSAVSIYDVVLSQQGQAYYRNDGALTVAASPGVKIAWQLATGVSAIGESAQLGKRTPQWVAAAQSRRFATLPCSSWMLGWMKRNVPDLRNDWDITAAPGGKVATVTRYLAVPATGAHQHEARMLAEWLAAADRQVTTFDATDLLPASAQARSAAAVGGALDPFFNNAPTGRILTDSLNGNATQPLGPRGAEVNAAVQQLVTQVDSWAISTDAGWAGLAAAYPA